MNKAVSKTRSADLPRAMIMTNELYLEGVPIEHVRARLSAAGGNEEASGKLASPDSSAALAVNAFGWFIPRPELLPAFPDLESAFPAEIVDVEYQARQDSNLRPPHPQCGKEFRVKGP